MPKAKLSDTEVTYAAAMCRTRPRKATSTVIEQAEQLASEWAG